jgi:hypothetical protein
MTSRPDLVIAGPDIATMAALLTELSPAGLAPTVVQSSRPVFDLTRSPRTDADVAIVYLSGDEEEASIDAMLDANPGVAFILATADEPSVVVAASLTALLAPRVANA